MVGIRDSFSHWVHENHRDLYKPVVILGHTELINSDMYNEYLEWCETAVGRLYFSKEEDIF